MKKLKAPNITIGPVIKKDSVRDAVKFIKFNDFVNQLDFAGVSRIIKTRVMNEIIGPLNQSLNLEFGGELLIGLNLELLML